MQVNNERLKELITNVAKSDDVACPNISCDLINISTEKCVTCWTEYLKEPIW